MMQYRNILWTPKGLDLSNQPTNAGELVNLVNYYLSNDKNSTTKLGVITKALNSYTLFKQMPITGDDNGLYYYFNNGDDYIFSSIKNSSGAYLIAYSLQNDNWITILDSNGSDLSFYGFPMNFCEYYDVFRKIDTLYFSNGFINYKWFSDTENITNNKISCMLSDCGGTAVSLTGTLTFTKGSNVVTGSGTSFTTEVVKGNWIKPTNGAYYEVLRVESDTKLYLRTEFQENNYTGSAVKAPYWNYTSMFMFIWFDKLWQFNMMSYGGKIDVATIDESYITGELNSYKRLHQSATFSSATPQAFETFSGYGTGWIEADLTGKYGTAYAILGDYLLLFSEKDYCVYRYNSTLIPSVSLSRKFNYGCISHKTIAYLEDSIIYFTGNDVRQTNGFQDISIASDIIKDLEQRAVVKEFGKYLDGTYPMPTAVYDKHNKIYRLYVTYKDENGVIDYTQRLEYSYSVTDKRWIGTTIHKDAGSLIYLDYYYNDINRKEIIYNKLSNGNYLYAFGDITKFDSSNSGIIKVNDIVFTSPKTIKNISYVELWIHIGVSSGTQHSVDIKFTPYFDAKASNSIIRTITNNLDDSEYVQKVRFYLNNKPCKTFSFTIEDINMASNLPLSIVGGIISYTESEGV